MDYNDYMDEFILLYTDMSGEIQKDKLLYLNEGHGGDIELNLFRWAKRNKYIDSHFVKVDENKSFRYVTITRNGIMAILYSSIGKEG